MSQIWGDWAKKVLGVLRSTLLLSLGFWDRLLAAFHQVLSPLHVMTLFPLHYRKYS